MSEPTLKMLQEAMKLLGDDSLPIPYDAQSEEFKEWAHQERLKDYTQNLFGRLYGGPRR